MNRFKDLGLKEDLLKKMKKNGINIPTEIQEECIRPIIEEKDIIGEAPTGTGKTLAFLLPMLQNTQAKKGLQSLILTPTRELALQIAKEAEKYNYKNIDILNIYGGKGYKNQIKGEKNSAEFIIATPGRLIDLIGRKLINLSKLNTLVLDEADQMLFMGFQNEVNEVVKFCPKQTQVLCFSATMDKAVKKLAYRITKDPFVVKVNPDGDNSNIEKFLVNTTDREKLDALCTVMNKENPFMALIFCRTKARVDKIELKLEERGYNIQKIHSDILQSKREKIIDSFRAAEIQYLVATDVASRGLDIRGVTHIFNLDMPEKAETYVHRIGRSGRCGEKGKSYLFSTPKDNAVLEEIENILGYSLERLQFEVKKDVVNSNEVFSKKYNKKINIRTKEKWEDKRRKK